MFDRDLAWMELREAIEEGRREHGFLKKWLADRRVKVAFARVWEIESADGREKLQQLRALVSQI